MPKIQLMQQIESIITTQRQIIKLNKTQTQSLTTSISMRQCIIRQFNLFEYNKGGNILVVQKGYKRIRKFQVPWFEGMRFGTNLTCILSTFNNITTYNLTLGKSIINSLFNPPCKDNLFEVSNNMRYLYLKGQLFELWNQRQLNEIGGLKIAQFTICNNYFYCINGRYIFVILNVQKQEIISKIKLDQCQKKADFILLDIERKILIQEFWSSKKRSCVKLDYNTKERIHSI